MWKSSYPTFSRLVTIHWRYRQTDKHIATVAGHFNAIATCQVCAACTSAWPGASACTRMRGRPSWPTCLAACNREQATDARSCGCCSFSFKSTVLQRCFLWLTLHKSKRTFAHYVMPSKTVVLTEKLTLMSFCISLHASLICNFLYHSFHQKSPLSQLWTPDSKSRFSTNQSHLIVHRTAFTQTVFRFLLFKGFCFRFSLLILS